MKLKKDNLTITLTNPIQIAAYISAGWYEVKEAKKDEKEKKQG